MPYQNSFVPVGISTLDLTGLVTPTIPDLAVGTYEIKAVTQRGTIRAATFGVIDPTATVGPADVLNDVLIAKPAVYAAFPSPFSITANNLQEYGIFSIIVANPTNLPMTVNRASLQVLGPFTQKIFKGGTGYNACEVIPDPPPPGSPYNIVFAPLSGGFPVGTWYCADGAIWWEEKRDINGQVVDPLVISPYSATNFIIGAQAVGTTMDSSAINFVATNVYTSLGQFGGLKTDTMSTHGKKGAMPNIYQCSSQACNDITYVRLGVPDNVDTEFYYAIENTGFGAAGKADILKDVSYIVLNTPKEFGEPQFLPAKSSSTGWGLVTKTQLYDGSWHMKVKITEDILAKGKKIFAFSITPPNVPQDSLYVFYANAQGRVKMEADGGISEIPMGPVSESVIQIVNVS